MKRIGIGFVLFTFVAIILMGCPFTIDPPLDTTITLFVIPGVTAPVTGATPVTSTIDTEQYTGSISWNPAHATFAASTVYTATITLTPKADFMLSGVAANSFTVAGATATNGANSGVVTAVFPATGDGSYTSPTIGILRYVPAGCFQRDGTTGNISVITQPYRMSQYEITRAQFQTIVGTDPSRIDYSSGVSDPVQNINFYYAITFCNKLSLIEGLTPVYSVVVDGVPINWGNLTSGSIPTVSNTDWNNVTADWNANGYRLPTETEWMWAAMGAPVDGRNGGTNTTGYLKRFSGCNGSNGYYNYVWNFNNSDNKTHPVGTRIANELGIFDMSGNVWEWCWDLYDTYPEGTLFDYRGIISGANRVCRGYSWEYGSISDFALSNRSGGNPHGFAMDFGFRVVRNY